MEDLVDEGDAGNDALVIWVGVSDIVPVFGVPRDTAAVVHAYHEGGCIPNYSTPRHPLFIALSSSSTPTSIASSCQHLQDSSQAALPPPSPPQQQTHHNQSSAYPPPTKMLPFAYTTLGGDGPAARAPGRLLCLPLQPR